MTSNGKVDRKALPKPDREMDGRESYAEPRNDLEQELAKIWSQVLRVKRIGIHDNFFSLGGNSILSIQVASAAREQHLYFTPKDLFQNPTIAELASLNLTGVTIDAEQGLVAGELPLTPIQHWFFEEHFEEQNHWNQAQLFIVDERLDIDLLQKSFVFLLQHHDALRLRFIHKNKQYIQFYDNTPSAEHIVLQQIDLTTIASKNKSRSLQTYANQLQSQFDITHGPILSAAVFTGFEDKKDRLFIAIHHLVIDGVSWRILSSDLERCYQQLKLYKTAKLSLKTSSYKDWQQALTLYAQNNAIRDLDYWTKVQQSITPLKTDLLSQQQYDFPGDPNTPLADKTRDLEPLTGYLTFSLNKLETYELINKSQNAYHTEINDLLISAFALAMQRWQKNDVISFNLEGHGREEVVSGVDITRTVGWFTSLFPLVLHAATY